MSNKHEEYLQRRSEFLKIRSNSFESFDKTILTLSTGAIALTITFLDKIGKPIDKITFLLIILTWITLIIVILSNLLSFYFAQRNMDKKIIELDNNYKKYLNEQIKYNEIKEKTFWQHKAVLTCNKISLIAFFIGIFFLLTYVSLIQMNNYKKEINMVDKKILNNGKVESNQAISILRKGQVEAQQPISNPDNNSTGKKK